MAGVNKVIIVGNLGADPELRTMPNGTPVANISVATTESWIDKNTNDRRELTEWHRIVFYRRQAEVAGEYLRKGSKVYVEGRLRTRKWQDQNGQDRYTTEIQGDVLQMLDSRSERQSQVVTQPQPQPQPQQSPQPRQQYQYQSAPQPQQNNYQQQAPQDIVDDDIPF